MDNRQAHPTKKGPGRKHGHKVSHGAAPTPPKGGFLGQRVNPSKTPSRRAQHRAAVRLALLAASPLAHEITPKASKERKRIQRPHATRDEIGAVTLIGPRVHFEGVKPGRGWFILSGSTDHTYVARRIWSPACHVARG